MNLQNINIEACTAGQVLQLRIMSSTNPSAGAPINGAAASLLWRVTQMEQPNKERINPGVTSYQFPPKGQSLSAGLTLPS